MEAEEGFHQEAGQHPPAGKKPPAVRAALLALRRWQARTETPGGHAHLDVSVVPPVAAQQSEGEAHTCVQMCAHVCTYIPWEL